MKTDPNITYSELPTGDWGANLRRAIACYEAALRVRTEADFPADWAGTQTNLGLAFEQMGEVERAGAAFTAAVRGYHAVGDEASAQEVEAYRDALCLPGRESGSSRDGIDD